VAIVHYWLVAMRGGERVLERLLSLFPQADIFTHVHAPRNISAQINACPIRTTFIQSLPFAQRFYQYYLPLMPMALEQLDLRGYDLVISSESGPAKGVITDPGALHLCYCHSPMRYLWDHYHLYRAQANPLARLAMPMLYHALRKWDTTSSLRVDKVVANSSFIRQRIRKSWGRDASVIHPPVDVDGFAIAPTVGDQYLWVGQMVPYKRPDLAVEAFNRTGRPLLMVGDGPMRRKLEAIAGPNVTIIPRLDFASLKQAYASARALVFTAEEDFGIIPVEVLASGRPVLGYGKGGIIDTVDPGRTGIFFARQEVDDLVRGIEEMDDWLPGFEPDAAVASAQRFRPELFDARIMAEVAGG
jgi:glycosyltransferase involved in cell wall biosynthesis